VYRCYTDRTKDGNERADGKMDSTVVEGKKGRICGWKRKN
jgi:hypothetical protein